MNLTNILCKTFEWIVNKRLVSGEKNRQQFGFRKQRSTKDELSKITKILDKFKTKEKQLHSSSTLRKSTKKINKRKKLS